MPDKPVIRVDRPEALRELVAAGMLLNSELSLERVLEQMVGIARRIVGSRYAALAVVGRDRVEQFVQSGVDTETEARIGDPPRGHGILGVLLREANPVRLDDVTRDPRSVGFPPHHPHMKSFLGVPVVARGSIFGNLYLTDKIGASQFTTEDEAVAVTLAAQAGVAVENARLIEQERARLEEKAELDTERARAQLRGEVFRRAIQAQEDERRRLARELHDETGQALTSIILGLSLLEGEEEAEKVRDRLATVREQAVAALRDLRRLAVRIRPAALDDLGLVPAIRRLLDESPLQHKAAVRFRHTGIGGRLDSTAETVIYRIVQEALTNVTRHARANRVTVTLQANGDRLTAAVEDDGMGFDGTRQESGIGLAGMRERAQLVGGTLSITSEPGKGTAVTVMVPLSDTDGE